MKISHRAIDVDIKILSHRIFDVDNIIMKNEKNISSFL